MLHIARILPVALALVCLALPAPADTRHGVFTFDCADAGFSPNDITTDLGKSTIFIRNVTNHAQQYTITRKRGNKKKVLFSGETIAGQAIQGDTKFRSGDVYLIKENNTGAQAKITVR